MNWMQPCMFLLIMGMAHHFPSHTSFFMIYLCAFVCVCTHIREKKWMLSLEYLYIILQWAPILRNEVWELLTELGYVLLQREIHSNHLMQQKGLRKENKSISHEPEMTASQLAHSRLLLNFGCWDSKHIFEDTWKSKYQAA